MEACSFNHIEGGGHKQGVQKVSAGGVGHNKFLNRDFPIL